MCEEEELGVGVYSRGYNLARKTYACGGRVAFYKAEDIYEKLTAYEEQHNVSLFFTAPLPAFDNGQFVMQRVLDLPWDVYKVVDSVTRKGVLENFEDLRPMNKRRYQILAGESSSVSYIATHRLLFSVKSRFFRPAYTHGVLAAEELKAADLPFDSIMEGMGEFTGFMHFVLGSSTTGVKFMAAGIPYFEEVEYFAMGFDRANSLSSDTAQAIEEICSCFTSETLKSLPLPGDAGWELFLTSYLQKAAEASKGDIANAVILKLSSSCPRLLPSAPDRDLFHRHWDIKSKLPAALHVADLEFITILAGSYALEAGYVGRGFLSAALESPCSLEDVTSRISAFGCTKSFVVFVRDEQLADQVSAWALSNQVNLRVFQHCNILLYKVAGAAALPGVGRSLDEVVTELQIMVSNTTTITTRAEAERVELIKTDFFSGKMAIVLNSPSEDVFPLVDHVAMKIEAALFKVVCCRCTFFEPGFSMLLIDVKRLATLDRLTRKTTAPLWNCCTSSDAEAFAV